MDVCLIRKKTLSSMADEIRRLSGKTDSMSAETMASLLQKIGLADNMEDEAYFPKREIVEIVSPFSITPFVLKLKGLVEEIKTVYDTKTIYGTDLLKWEYNERYIELGANGVQTKTTWTYESTEQTIDSGRMNSVKAITSDLSSVISFEVNV